MGGVPWNCSCSDECGRLQHRGETKYVVPVYGAGLWGGIWGYVALNEDKDTVYGVYFSQAGGLCADHKGV